MSECTVCARKTQLFLCQTCATDLHDLLRGLAVGQELPNGKRSEPRLEAMEDVRFGRTRLGESARHSGENNSPLMVRLGPDPEKQWDGSPIEFMRAFHGTIATWVKHLTETRGTTFIPVHSVPVWFIGPLHGGWRRLSRDYRASTMDCVEWLSHHIDAIACDEGAGELFRDVRDAVSAIERMINRPVDAKYCGNCPSIIEDKDGQHECAVALYVPWDHHAQQYAVEVQCWRCGATYNADKIIQDALKNVDGLLYSAREVQEIMAQTGNPIRERTWRYWRAQEKIIVRGWRGGEPMYWINDVVDLMAQKPQKMPTGAAVRRVG